MIRSMTGYSSVRETINQAVARVEIKTLNHKSQDVHFHAPRSLAMLELPIRDQALKRIRRGRIEIYIRVAGDLAPQDSIRVNPIVAQAYVNAARQVAESIGSKETPSLHSVLSFDGVIESDDNQDALKELAPAFQAIAARALDALIEMKTTEGLRLKTELEAQLEKMQTIADGLPALRERVITEHREKLLGRIAEWKQAPELDPNRIAQELAFYADRSDIQEESVRLKSHIQQFRDILNENVGAENYAAVGRRLDFLCQELFREANTIGSKSASLDITQRGLDLKSVIEQLREQVQNVE